MTNEQAARRHSSRDLSAASNTIFILISS
uniref:Uncharacterized protein n=1 Tax=Anguilla anguilla TaxID=7936 RepID=A0A0E9RWG1_ANGAN